MLRQFEKDLDVGDELLAPLFMLTGGGPPRWTEMACCRWTNGQGHMRNFYQIFGMLAMITMYNKAEVMSHAPRVVVRFYPSRVGRVALAMISEVLPFWTLLQVSVGQKPDFGHQWWERGSGKLTGNGMTSALRKVSKRYLGVELGVRDLRHVLIGIDRELIRQPLADAQDSTERGAYEAQTGHSEHTEALNYAVALADLNHTNQKTLRAYFGTSTRSHDLFGISEPSDLPVPATEMALKKGKGGIKTEDGMSEVKGLMESLATQVERLSMLNHELTVSKASTPTLQASLVQSQDRPAVVGPDRIGELLQRLYGRTAVFRPGQLQACETMLNNTNDLFVQLPTGGGKTLLVEISALQNPDRTAVMFVPYTALRQDLVNRLRAVGVDARVFTHAGMGYVSVVLVTPEKAAERDFGSFWDNACAEGRISRVFWDECHLIEMEATNKAGGVYRPYQQVLDYCARPGLDRVRLPQRVFMSATLPGHIMEAVQVRANATKANVVRTPTCRPTLRWEVRTVAGDQMDAELQHIVGAARPGKALIYVMSVEDGERLARITGWSFYHGKSGEDGCRAMDRFWKADAFDVLIATTAAGSGWDVDVQLVVLYQGAFDAVTAAQQGGRAGRRPGTVGRCVTLLSKQRWPRPSQAPGTVAWEMFLATNGCRRVALETYIDNTWRPPCREGEEQCDGCLAGVVPEPRPVQPAAAPELDPHWSFDDWTNLSPGLPDEDNAGATWAFQNTMYVEETSSSELRGPADTEIWSSPPPRVRKLQELGDAEEAQDMKRVKPNPVLVPHTASRQVHATTTTFSMPPMPGDFVIPPVAQATGRQTARSVTVEDETRRLLANPLSTPNPPGASYNAPIALEVGTMVPATNAVEAVSQLLLDDIDTARGVWDQALAFERQQAAVAADQRVVTALAAMTVDGASCVYCWWVRAAPWTHHGWESCARRRNTMPAWDTKRLDGLKIRMKKVIRLPETICAVLTNKIHINCFAPFGRGKIHSTAYFDFNKDCIHTQRMLMVVLMGMQQEPHGAQIAARFHLELTMGEDQMARALIRTPLTSYGNGTMVLWDAFLFCWGYRDCWGRVAED